tara:strand:- start:3761 stop:3985 length:225 start_codon:yes stop_codon:yes gene_type:complete
MKVGDLVRVKAYVESGWPDFKCECFFCSGNSNRAGVVLGPAPRNSWAVMFDCGEWRLNDFEEARGEVKVISERY